MSSTRPGTVVGQLHHQHLIALAHKATRVAGATVVRGHRLGFLRSL